jgi:hypothetical protein
MYENEIEYTCWARIDGTSIKDNIESIEISMSETDYVNSVTINFNKKSASLFGTLCDPDVNFGTERIVISIDSTEYSFLLEKRTSVINSDKISFSVWGRSKAALLDLPYSGPFLSDSTAVIEVDARNYMASIVMAKAIAHSDYTVDLDFQIDDFPVYSDQYIIEGKTPIQVINELAAVPGGRVRSKRDGSLIVEYKSFSTDYKNSVVDLSDIDMVLQLDETITHPTGINRVRVVGYSSEDVIRSDSDLRIELDPDYDQTCIQANKEAYIRVYSSPQGLNYAFDTSLGSFISRGSMSATFTETLIVNDGNANTAYPINTITTSQWIGDNLGSFDHEKGYNNINVPTGGYGVLQITYTSIYDSYIVIVGEAGTALLYALENISE